MQYWIYSGVVWSILYDVTALRNMGTKNPKRVGYSREQFTSLNQCKGKGLIDWILCERNNGPFHGRQADGEWRGGPQGGGLFRFFGSSSHRRQANSNLMSLFLSHYVGLAALIACLTSSEMIFFSQFTWLICWSSRVVRLTWQVRLLRKSFTYVKSRTRNLLKQQRVVYHSVLLPLMTLLFFLSSLSP